MSYPAANTGIGAADDVHGELTQSALHLLTVLQHLRSPSNTSC